MYTEKFDSFTVYKSDNSSCFVYVNIDNKQMFMNDLAEYFVNEDNLINYSTGNYAKTKNLDNNQYIQIYRNIEMFLNHEIENKITDNLTKEEIDLMIKEGFAKNKEDGIYIQNDKVGKIFEYSFHIFLQKYYNLNCIIPKVKLQTNRNMNVYGIDTIFYDEKNKTIYFGESKCSKTLEGGIELINRSLLNYEKQIREEYILVLSKIDIYNLSNNFIQIFKEQLDNCIKFDEFIDKAKIKEIGIPLFIAHGTNQKVEIEEYLNKMNNCINKKELFGLKTKYILVSLPIINKDDFIKVLFSKIIEKEKKYKEIINNENARS